MAFGADELALLFKVDADTKAAQAEMASLARVVKKEVNSIERELASNTGAIGRMAAGMGGAGLTTAAFGGALALATGALVGMAIKTGEAGSRINDLSIKTGLSVETLSGLNLQAKQSGTSLEALAGGVFILQKNLASATDGNKTLKKSFADLGIKDTKSALADMDGTLRQLLKGLAAIPDEGRRNAEGARVMGKSYKDLSVLVDDLNGDLDGAIKTAREWGLVMSVESVRAADDFGDKLDQLKGQVGGIAFSIASQAIPQIIRGIDDLSTALSGSKGNFESWGTFVRNVMISVRATAAGLKAGGAALVANINDPHSIGLADKAFYGAMNASIDNSFKSLSSTPPPKPRRTGNDDNTSYGGGSGGSKGGGGGVDKATQERVRQIEQESKELERAYRRKRDGLKREYDLQIISLQDFTQKSIDAENEHYEKQKAAIEKQLALAKKGSDQDKYRDELIDAEAEHGNRVQAMRDDQNKKENDSLRQHKEEELRLVDEYGKQYIESLRETAEIRETGYVEAEDKILEVQTTSYEHHLQLLKDDEDAIVNNAEKRQEIDDKIAALVQAQTLLQEDAARRRIAAEDKEIASHRRVLNSLYETQKAYEAGDIEERRRALDEADRRSPDDPYVIAARATFDLDESDAKSARIKAEITAQREEAERLAKTEEEKLAIRQNYNALSEQEERRHQDERARIQHEADAKTERNDPTSGRSMFGDLFADTVENTGSKVAGIGAEMGAVFAQMSKGAGNMTTMVGGALKGLVSGVQDLATQWILTGKLSGKAVRQMAASVLAGLATQALGKALWEGAEALAEYAIGVSLAANPFTAALAPGHFAAAAAHTTAAAAYGALGLGAAVIGRAIAGNSFAGAATGANGVANQSRAAAGDRSSNDPKVINENRRTQAAPQQVHIHLHGDIADKRIADVVVRNINNNGSIRRSVRREAGVEY